MKDYFAFTPYYHEMPNCYNTGNLSLLIFESTEYPSDRYSPRVFQEGSHGDKPFIDASFSLTRPDMPKLSLTDNFLTHQLHNFYSICEADVMKKPDQRDLIAL